MKRGAEKQLSKDDGSDDEIQEVSASGSFKKADESALATRKIRALPKRSLAGTPPPVVNDLSTPEAPSTPTPKFGAFGGFGSPASSSNPFVFTPPPSLPASTQPSAATSPFGSLTSTPTPIKSPSIASNASNTAKTFASLLGDSSKSFSSSQGPTHTTNTFSTQSNKSNDPAALKYYTSLRGLNVSFIAAISNAVDNDPFTDITDMVERYKDLRSTVQKEFDDKPVPTLLSAPFASASKSLSMPAPPTTFAGFGPPSSSGSWALPKPASGSGGFIPKVAGTPSSSSGFTLPSPLVPPSSTPSSVSLFGSNGTTSFGTSMFKNSAASTSDSTFKTTLSQSAANTPSASEPDSKDSSNILGGSSTPSTSNLFGNSDKPALMSAFGTSTPATPSKPAAFGGFGGFGKSPGSGGSIGNPVGFGFGSPSGSSNGSTAPIIGGAGFFSAPSATSKDSESNEGHVPEEGMSDTKGEEGERENPEKEKGNFGLLANSPHDEEGEGEEDEETVHSVKLKAFRMKKAEEKGGVGWVELGLGILRLKIHKQTGARRALLRNSSTGKINMNFNIYSGLKPSQTKKSLTFVGHDNGVAQTYSVRLQTEDQAKELKDAMDKEIAYVKSKSEE